MTSDRWSAVKYLFEQALDKPSNERERWLQDACDGDAELLSEAGRLLAAEGTAQHYFDTLGNRLRSERGEAELPAPKCIGPWRVIREVGRGGMGRVFEAVRNDGMFEQRVAVKVVDSHSSRLVRRFEQERRILADLEHPNIGRLLDGGALQDGRPYLVMEYVEGMPITAFAEENQRTVDDRLELFLQVCDAVAFAHRHLVVHRDLKPSNVLVTEEGAVKLLDFGIARILGEEGSPEEGLTATGRRLLTPHFAAPEQIVDGAITTATDVYSLGVLLYLLLVGRKPFGETGDSQRAVEQEILERNPTAPSAVLARQPKQERGSMDPVRRSRRLRGDLDRIILKALRKEPERRYPSAEALARDVRRHLDGLPVEARPATVLYRVSSFAKRHRTGIFVTLAVLLSVAIGSVLFTTRIAAERDRAEYVSDFLTDILSRAGDPDSNPSALFPLLDPAVARAEQELASAPDAQAEVFKVAGTLYLRTGRPDVARHLLQRALLIQRRLHPDGHEDIAESLYSLGKTFIGADHDSSAHYFGDAVEHYRSVSSRDSDELAWSILQWSRMLPVGHPPKKSLFEEAMTMLRRVHGERSPQVADALHEYYVLGLAGATPEETAAVFEETIAIYAENGMEDHLYRIHAMHNLGLVLDGRGESDRALDLLRRSVELARSSIDQGIPSRLVMEVNLGAVLHERGQFEEADEYLHEAAAQSLRFLPDSASGIGQSHYWHGRNLLALGQYAEAETALTTALQIQQHHDSANSGTLRTQAELALVLFHEGQQREAERFISEAIERLRGERFEERALEHALVIYRRKPEADRLRRRLEEVKSGS